MKKAIEKLKELATFNAEFADRIESGEFELTGNGADQARESLPRTYRYWSNCLFIAAWLLENEAENETKKSKEIF